LEARSANNQHNIDVLSHGARLNRLASGQLKDANEAHLLVHIVVARAMRGDIAPVTAAGMDASLWRALAIHTCEVPAATAQVATDRSRNVLRAS
jgi:hypothetical protein